MAGREAEYVMSNNEALKSMKRIFIYIIASINLLCLSCSESQDTLTEEEVTVTLNLTGDFLIDVAQDPITKASSDDLYAVNVYRGDSSYASGLFDDISAMNVTLLSGYTYKFTCCLVKNGKSKLYYGKAFGKEDKGYAYPFQRGSESDLRPTPIENEFLYSTTFPGLTNGAAHILNVSPTTGATTSNATQYASINRYYGETSGYRPVHNGIVEIALKRVTFGVRIEVEGLKEGKLKVSFGDFLKSVECASDGVLVNQIYTFENPYECWNWTNTHSEEEPYSFAPQLIFSYINNGERSEYMGIWDKTKTTIVSLKRNIMTTIKITVVPDLSGIISSVCEEPFSEENVINIGVQGGSLIDTGVNPNE